MYAAVQFSNEEGRVKGSITDEQGKAENPFFDVKTNVEISHLGFDPLFFTLNPNETKIVYLTPLPENLQEVIVTGVAISTVKDESVPEVQTISKKEIENRAANNVSQVLNNEINMRIKQDGIIGSELQLQGMTGNSVKIMVDGVPVVGRQAGQYDLSQINTSNVERIEIVEGPMSVIYGTDALAGVVNIITKTNQNQKWEGGIHTFYESAGTYNIDANGGFKKDKHLIRLNAGRHFFNGWGADKNNRNLEWDPKEQYFVNTAYKYSFKKPVRLTAKFDFLNQRILNRYDPSSNPNRAFDDWYKTHKYETTMIFDGRINKQFTFNSTAAYNFLNQTKNKYYKDLVTLETNLVPDSETNNEQDTTQYHQIVNRSMFTYKSNKPFEVTFGYDFSTETAQAERINNGQFTYLSDIAGFSSISYNPMEKITLKAGLRYGFNSKFIVLPTPTFHAKYAITDKWTIRTSYGYGFRSPTLKELYLTFRDSNHDIQGNENLVPENSHNVQLSVEHLNRIAKEKEVGVKLNGFYNDINNAIALQKVTDNTIDPTNENVPVFRYVTKKRHKSAGANIELKLKYQDFSLESGMGYTGIYNSEQENFDHAKPFFFSPSFRVNAEYYISKINMHFGIYGKYTGSFYDYTVDNGELIETNIASYSLIDFTMGKWFWDKRIHVSSGVKNVLGVGNVESTGVATTHSGTSSDNQALVSTGRTFFVGLKLRTK